MNKKTRRRDQNVKAETRRNIHWQQAIAGALIGTVFGAVVSTGINIYVRRAERAADNRVLALKIIRHARREWAWNANAARLRGDIALRLRSDPLLNQRRLTYNLSELNSTTFQQTLPQFWGSDLKTVLIFGDAGQAALEALTNLYRVLEGVETRQRSICALLEKETDARNRSALLRAIEETEGQLREPIAEADKALSQLPTAEN